MVDRGSSVNVFLTEFYDEVLSLSDNLSKSTSRIFSSTLNLTDTFSKSFIFQKESTEVITLTDSITSLREAEEILSETLTLTDSFIQNIYTPVLTETLSISDGDTTSWDALITLTETINLTVPSNGTLGESSLYIKDSDGNWNEYLDYEYFKVVKKQNQISEFEITIANIEAEDKLIVKEFAEVAFLSEENLILKGRIQKVTYETSYSCKITGFGMEVKLLDKEFDELSNTTATWSDSKRAQYTNTSAQTIANELLSSNSDGSSPWIIEPNTTGLFNTDYGNISMRFEYANRLKALANLCDSLVDPTYQIPYEWWLTQYPGAPDSQKIFGDDFATDYFNVAQLRPTTTRATVSQETFAITGANANAEQTSYEKDITNLANKVEILCYGDGINQIHTSTYNASPVYSSLASDVTDSSTTITLADASSFASSGTIRIMEEQITYSGKSSNDLTGCTRGANSTTAREHKKGCYIEKYVAIDSAEANSSIYDNGLMDYSITDRSILDLPTAELVASKILFERMTPIVRILVIPEEPLQIAGSREIGDLVTVVDAESGLNDEFRIVGMTYISDYGYMSMELELSNKTLNFIDQMKSAKDEAEKLSKYMQGSTNIYAINEAENCDATHPLNLRFYLPSEAVAVNKVLLSFKLKDFRAYSTGNAAETTHTHTIPINNEPASGNLSVVSILNNTLYSTFGATGGVATSSGGESHTHDVGYGINEETLTSPSVDLSVGSEGSESAVGTYTSDQDDIDITSEVSAVGVGNWINIKFDPNKRMRIESNAYIQIFIRSR